MSLFSRRGCAPELWKATANYGPSKKRRGRSAGRRIQPLAASADAAARFAISALASRRSTAALARLLPLTQLRAALPGITECKREDPPRRQCSEHLAGRS